MRIRRLLLDDDSHMDVCETLGYIANVCRKKDLDKSLTLFRFVLNTKLKLLSMNNEVECRELLVAYTDVLEVAKLKLVSERRNKSLHDEIATIFVKIGYLFEKMHQYNDAVQEYNKALKVRFENI